jgi:type I restriction enzyme M protein
MQTKPDIWHGGQANSYYDNPQDATGRFGFVFTNPPFNVNALDKQLLKDSVGPGCRFAFGLPRTDSGNYLWNQLSQPALKNGQAGTSGGRAGFVMANSDSDGIASQQEIRCKLK